ncbi:uncharacterized protein A4U43_C07F20060 [Asparagus officinalis]|uniref:Carbohydrate kinase PfkB domain-containing protein n=1 Tax=Asparagus officinalis TaxID=4686 RepID=A0A5P1EDE4_ASPOF|nr:uncharacterized protein A4U43_C07F20060 [Asparagus officinalis]
MMLTSPHCLLSVRPKRCRAEMSSSSSKSTPPPPPPENPIVVGGGGNVGNALTGAARLGLKPRIISKVADDTQGRNALAELERDGVDTSFMVVSEEGNSPFTYIIVDSQTKTRTCIHTPGYPPMVPDELSKPKLLSALDGANLVYFDVRWHETALVVAKEAARRKIPILVDSERKREGLDDLLSLATYVVCSEKFPQQWTEAPSTPSALVSMLLKLPNLKFVIVTLGEKGCIMLERSIKENSNEEEIDVESLLDSLKQQVDQSSTSPKCISSNSTLRIKANGIGAVCGRLLIGTADTIPPADVIDTTGAGDAFIGAVLYGSGELQGFGCSQRFTMANTSMPFTILGLVDSSPR